LENQPLENQPLEKVEPNQKNLPLEKVEPNRDLKIKNIYIIFIVV
jgi:hypothetical protein